MTSRDNHMQWRPHVGVHGTGFDSPAWNSETHKIDLPTNSECRTWMLKWSTTWFQRSTAFKTNTGGVRCIGRCIGGGRSCEFFLLFDGLSVIKVSSSKSIWDRGISSVSSIFIIHFDSNKWESTGTANAIWRLVWKLRMMPGLPTVPVNETKKLCNHIEDNAFLPVGWFCVNKQAKDNPAKAWA